jgi:release factor glutamine methyltransferase
MTKEQLVNRVAETLKQNGFESYKFEAKEIVDLVCNGVLSFSEVTTEQVLCAEQKLGLRLKNEPLQYILGEWEFYGLPFKVGRGVLIPRQDTETLVETALPLVKAGHKRVLDLCAGSGCIGITLAKLGGAEVTLVEKSDEALQYLKQNVELNKVNVTVKQYDVLTEPFKETVDMMVSNPPYIRSDVVEGLSEDVKKEPKMALDGGEDGLKFYRHIASEWKSVLKNGGYLIFEIGFDQETEVVGIMQKAGYQEVACIKDLGGNPRVVVGQKFS